MATDVVGYSALMGTDETGTVSALRTLRKEVWGPKADEHNGRIVKLTGDGQLTEFPSVADAVQCAVEMQRAMARRNADIPEAHRIVLRVGINIGDVIIDGEDMYGDGINVAARLEAMAEPGGICISRAVRDQIRDKLLFELEDLGEQELKNIARPVRVFRVSIEDAGATTGAQPSAPTARPAAPPPPTARPSRVWQAIAGAAVLAALAAIYTVNVWQPWVTRVEAANVANMAFPLPDKPSIAVLAFDNLSGDPTQESLAEGFSEDVLTSLSKLSSLFVISRTTSFTYRGKNVTVKQVAEDLGVRFVLEGSIQREGDSIRINAQLIDALSGAHIWSERYDRDMTDLFAVKDEVILSIVSNIGAELELGERDRVRANETDSLEAWLLQREGYRTVQKLTPADNVVGRRLLERAIELDPDFATAYANLALSYRLDGQLRWVEDREAAIQRAFVLYQRALEIDPNHGPAMASFASWHLGNGDVEAALEISRQAVSLEPSDYFTHAIYAWALAYSERPDLAIEEFGISVRLSPQAPAWVLGFFGEAYLIAGDPEMADRVAREMLGHPPASPTNKHWAHRNRALALDALGRTDDARAEVALATEADPRFRLSNWKANRPYGSATSTDVWVETLRRLGMPE